MEYVNTWSAFQLSAAEQEKIYMWTTLPQIRNAPEMFVFIGFGLKFAAQIRTWFGGDKRS